MAESNGMAWPLLLAAIVIVLSGKYHAPLPTTLTHQLVLYSYLCQRLAWPKHLVKFSFALIVGRVNCWHLFDGKCLALPAASEWLATAAPTNGRDFVSINN